MYIKTLEEVLELAQSPDNWECVGGWRWYYKDSNIHVSVLNDGTTVLYDVERNTKVNKELGISLNKLKEFYKVTTIMNLK